MRIHSHSVYMSEVKVAIAISKYDTKLSIVRYKAVPSQSCIIHMFTRIIWSLIIGAFGNIALFLYDCSIRIFLLLYVLCRILSQNNLLCYPNYFI